MAKGCVSFYPHETLRKKLEKESEKENRSLNQQIIHILQLYFQSKEKFKKN